MRVGRVWTKKEWSGKIKPKFLSTIAETSVLGLFFYISLLILSSQKRHVPDIQRKRKHARLALIPKRCETRAHCACYVNVKYVVLVVEGDATPFPPKYIAV